MTCASCGSFDFWCGSVSASKGARGQAQSHTLRNFKRGLSSVRSVPVILICSIAFQGLARAELVLSSGGKARCVLLQQSQATAPEQHAVAELKLHLDEITGASFSIVTDDKPSSPPAIIVGQGTLASKFFPELDLQKFGPEEFVIRAKNGRLLLAGGRPRGSIYAVNRFLQDQCGVRWWTPWATNIPHQPTLRVADLNIRFSPAFEYRGPYWFTGFDPLWKSRNGANDENHLIPAELGGCIRYKGFCHTFYPLVPPEKYFADHPEWYSMIKGKRTHDRAQLCLTNPQLRDFVVQRSKEWLRECPECEIISITQNDWFGACECPDCKALDDAEGSHSGTMLAFANYIADKIEPEFPNVAVDTFAYQYTRKPPKTLRARPNVIVRLCSIECNFREPLDHPSNAAFAEDIVKWSGICPRLYIWDYVTDFKNYILPHPNWFTLGPNLRFFAAHKVRGVFEEGAYGGYGSEMGELRAWVLTQLLWNPHQDDRKLIADFLQGYYGKDAAKPISQYLDLLYAASKDFYLACFLRKDPPSYLDAKTIVHAEQLWQQAEKAADPNQEFLIRVRIAHLPLRYAILKHWKQFRVACRNQNQTWPLSDSRKQVAAEFEKVCRGYPDRDWTHIQVLNEHGSKVEDFLKQVNSDVPPDPDN
jgi:hypothetical protein